MKVRIVIDELYPYYILDTDEERQREIEITPAFYRRYKRIMASFKALQNELEALNG